MSGTFSWIRKDDLIILKTIDPEYIVYHGEKRSFPLLQYRVAVVFEGVLVFQNGGWEPSDEKFKYCIKNNLSRYDTYRLLDKTLARIFEEISGI